MLTRVGFKGIKSLFDVQIPLTRFTVLVGPNGCGKSTVLDHIERLCRMSQPRREPIETGPEAVAVLKDLDLSRVRSARRDAPPMEWAGSTDERTVRVGVDGEVVTVASVVGTRAHEVSTASPPSALDAFDAHLRPLAWRAQRLRLNPRRIAEPSPVYMTEVEPDGFGTASVLKDLATDNTDAYLAVQRDLRSVVPQFEALSIPKVRLNAGWQYTLSFDMKGQGTVPANAVSDGTLTALALLAVTHNRALPNLVLMDDIDHGLHLGAQWEITQAIRRVLAVRPALQVVCTTHSPVLLDAFDISEVRVLALDADGCTHAKPLADHPDLDAWRRSMSSGELWANLGEDWVLA